MHCVFCVNHECGLVGLLHKTTLIFDAKDAVHTNTLMQKPHESTLMVAKDTFMVDAKDTLMVDAIGTCTQTHS